MPFERKWLLGFVDENGELRAMANVDSRQRCALGPPRRRGGHARAERFWHRAGYREVRRRQGVVMGERVNTVVVMVKALAATDGLSEYLAVVARDRPESS
jgi:hypothetical protein